MTIGTNYRSGSAIVATTGSGKKQVIRVLVRGNKSDQGTGPKQQEWSGYWPDSVKTTGVGF
jgi:hypothetical protein